jgi:predicted cupin superfamily sugar epimerase
MSQMDAAQVIATLGLERHPEGGWYVQTFEDAAGPDGRPHSTAIYYLIEAGDSSHWHRVDAAEVWHWYAGAPLRLRISDGQSVTEHVLGNDLARGERPQIVVPVHAWQAAVSTGAWTLVGCTVAPGFRFSGFELAAPDWAPAGR